MTFKDISVFADGSDDGRARFSVAAALATQFDAHLDAHVVALMPMHPYGVGAAAMADAYEEVRGAAHQAGRAVTNQLRAASADLGECVTVHQHDLLMADVRTEAAIVARASDMVVLGQPEDSDRTSLDTDLLVGALLGGGRPVLMVPRWRQPHAWGKRAVIAWKGTPESARAVHEALPLLQRADSVRILAAAPRGDAFGEGQLSLQRLAGHLARHGVKVHEALLRASDGEPERVVLSEVEGFGADLLVMGGYGRSRMSEIVWGGVTRTVIRSAQIPVLMSH